MLLVLLVIIGFFVGLGITGGKTEKKEQREPEEGQSTERNIIQEIPHYVLYCEEVAPYREEGVIELPITIESAEGFVPWWDPSGVWMDNLLGASFFIPYWEDISEYYGTEEESLYIEENKDRYANRIIFDITNSWYNSHNNQNILLADGSKIVLGKTLKATVKSMFQDVELMKEDTTANTLLYKVDDYISYAFYFDEGDCAYRLDVCWEYDGCAIVNAEEGIVRKEPDKDPTIVSREEKGAVLKILGEKRRTDGLWYMVSNNEGVTGYIFQDQVILTD